MQWQSVGLSRVHFRRLLSACSACPVRLRPHARLPPPHPTRSLDVQTREGVPFKPVDLHHVAAHRARHIILLQGPGASAPASEALGAAAAMSLATLPASKDQSIVVQVPGVVPSGAEVLLSLASSAGLVAVQSRFRWAPAAPPSRAHHCFCAHSVRCCCWGTPPYASLELPTRAGRWRRPARCT